MQVAYCVKASPIVRLRALGLCHLSPERKTLVLLTDVKIKDGQEVQIKNVPTQNGPSSQSHFLWIIAAMIMVKL